MTFSDKGLKRLERWERDILHVYRDQAGLKTIGIGHLLTRSELASGKIVITGTPVEYVNGITEQQSLDLLAQDVVPAENAVNSHVTVTLTQNQFDALVSFTFNCGDGAFTGSTLLKVLNQGQYAQVPEQLKRWTYAKGKLCDGLIERRNNEIRLWNGLI